MLGIQLSYASVRDPDDMLINIYALNMAVQHLCVCGAEAQCDIEVYVVAYLTQEQKLLLHMSQINSCISVLPTLHFKVSFVRFLW